MSLQQLLGVASPAGSQSSSEAEKTAGQRRTFAHWVNAQLKKGKTSARTVSDVIKDFEDGVVLIHLLESLAVGKKMPGKYYTLPSTNIQKMQNLAIAFRFMKDMEKIPLPALSPRDLLQRRLQPILNLLWSIFLHYNFEFHEAMTDLGQRQREAKRLLLQWLRGTLPDRNISNLTTDWSDGVNISALVNSCRPGLISKFASLSRSKGDKNVQKALDLAHSKLGVPQVLEPIDMASANPDERCIMLYLSYFPKLGQKSLSEWASQVLPAAPEKVKVVKIRLPDEPGAGAKLAWVEIDCSEAGHGLVRGEALGSKGEAIPAAVEDLGDDKYRVQFSLSQADLYQASIYYGDGQIAGSPFTLNMLPPDAELVQHLGTFVPEMTGDAVTLAFDTKQAGRGKLSAQATNESGETMPVEVEHNLDGTFKVLFVPPEPDVYTVDVNWGHFSVQGEDLAGNELTVDVHQKPDSDCRLCFGVSTLRTDTYKVTVLWEGKPVPGSPFQVNLLVPAKPENVEAGVPIFTSIMEPLDIPIDVSEAGSGILTAHCVGEISGEVPVTISGPKRAPYMVSFTPLHDDLFTLSVLFNKTHITRSPFIIDLRKGMMTIQEEPEEEKPPVVEEPVEAVPMQIEESVPDLIDPSQCKLLGWEKFQDEHLIARQPITVSVDTKGAGLGQLQVGGKVPVGEKESRIDIKTREDDPEIYDVTYTPHAVGTHALDFLWSDQPIPDAAVSFKVKEDERVQTYIHGHPINMELDSDSKPSDLKSYAVHEDTNTQHKVKITKVQRGKYRLNFQPKEPGIYLVHILAKDKPIGGSPLIVRYGRPPKPEAIRVNGLQKKCFLGEPLIFSVDCNEAGSGELSIRATAPKAKKDKSDLKIKDNKDGTFQVEYTPVSLGEHSLAVTWSGMPAPGSPFHITVLEEEPKALETDASKCVITGIDRLPNLLQVGKDIPFMVDTSSAGAGDLEGTVECPDQDEPPKIHISRDEKDRNIYHVNFTPTAPGLYRLHFKWGGDSIPRSPLSFDVADIQSVPHGKPMALEFGADCKLADIAAHAIHEDSHTKHKVKIEKGQKGKYKISLEPTEPGVYAIHVFIRNKEISGSPFRFKLRKPPQPENCKVLDFPKEGQVGYYSTFIIDARDAGSGELGIRSVAPSSAEKPHLAVVDLKNRTFRVEYIPNVPGDHQFHITWNGQRVPGCPYQLPVTVDEEYASMEWKAPTVEEEPSTVFLDTIALDSPPAERKPTELTTVVGKVLKVKVKPQADQVGKGELVATVKGDSTGEGKAQVVKTRDGGFVLSFSPSVADRYVIDMSLNDEPVPKTPIIATYLPQPSDPSKVRLLGVEDIPIPPVADQPIHFQVDVREAGAGTLGIVAKLSQPEPRPKIQVRALKDEPKIIEVDYTPVAPGLHSIELNWSKKEIPGSPIQFTVSEPQKEESLEDTMASLLMSMPPRIDWEEPVISGIGEPVEVPLEVATSKPGALLTATCSGEECGEVPVGVQNPSPTKYKFSFTPPVPDLYTIHAYQDGEELKGSPYTVDLRRKPRPPSFVEEAFEQEIATIEESALPMPPMFPDFGSSSHEEEEEETVLEDEPEVRPMEEHTTYIGRALLVKVRPEIEEQKKGELVARATGDKTGPVDISVSRKSEDLFLIAFNPQQPDRYTIEAKLNGEHIPRSPFVVNYLLPPPDASKCTILGLRDLPEVLEVDNEIPLVVDATRAGRGILDVHIDGPTKDREPPKLEVSPTEEDPARFQVNYLPTAPGTHTINLQWSDKHIPGSPVKLVVVDMASVETQPFGVPFGIDVVADCKPSELKAYAIHEGTKTPLKVKATRLRRDRYKLTFSPTGYGLFYIHVLARDKEVRGSPFVVRIAEPPKPEAVTIEGLTNRGYVGEVVNFTINGTKAGSGEPQVKALGPGRKEKGDLRLQDNKDRTYSVEYTPSVPGNHQFQVSWAGKAVPGSPCPLQVRERADEELFVDLCFKDRVGSLHSVELPGEAEGAVPKVNGTTDNALVWNIKAQTNEQKNGKLVATATGDRVGPAEVKVSKQTADTFEMLFSPPEPDQYTVEAQLNGQPVPLTPVAVNYTTPPADVSLVKVIGLENIPPLLQVDKEIPFKVDTRLAGEGTLGFTADVPEGEKEPVQLQVSEDEPHIHSVSYTPTVPGSHTLNLTWGEGAIPLKFDVSTIPVFPSGKKAEVEMKVDGKIGDTEAHAIDLETGTRYKVKIHKVQQGKLRFSFSPKGPGIYELHVLHKKKPVPGSPFYIRILRPGEVVIDKVLADVPRMPSGARGPAVVALDTRDAGRAKVTADCVDRKGDQVPVTVKEKRPDIYMVSFEPPQPEIYTLGIQYGGVPIKDSPFTIDTLHPDATKVRVTEPENVELSQPVHYLCDAHMAGPGELTASCHGNISGDVPVKIDTLDKAKFDVSYVPEQPDHYQLRILWSDENVPDSPFSLNLLPAAPDKVEFVAPEIPTESGAPVDMPVDITEAGLGVLSAKCMGEYYGDVPVRIEKKSRNKQKIKFVPPGEDLYTLSMYLDNVEIKGSPQVIDTRKAKPPPLERPVTPEILAVMEEAGMVESGGPSLWEFPDFGPQEPEEEPPKPISEEITNFVGNEFVLEVNAEEEGGRLTATAVGDRVGSTEITVQKPSNSEFKVVFNPPEPDRYTIGVMLNDSHIPGSPFVVNYLQPPGASGCVLKGLDELPDVLKVDSEIPLVVDTTQAGEGVLNVGVDGPTRDQQPLKLEVKPTEENPAIYQVNYLPTAPGTHTLNLEWADTHIPGSPVKLTVVDTAVVETYPFGAPVGLEVDSDCKLSELRAYALREDSSTTQRVKIAKAGKGKYKLTFSPTGHGLFYIHLLARDKEVRGSPFVVRIAEPPKPEAVTIEGLTNRGYVGEVVNFTINGTKAGSGEPSVRVAAPGRKDTAVVVDNKDRTYSVEYTPSVPGNHQFQVSWAGKAVPGSPCPLQVGERADEELFVDLYFKDRVGSLHSVELPGEAEGAVPKVNGTTDNALVWNIKAQTNEQKNGKLVATATGDRVGPAEVKVSKPTADTFEMLFSPPEPDQYTVEAQLNGQPVPLTPVAVNYTTPPADVSLVKVIGLENVPSTLQVNKEIPFKVDTRLAGEGTLGFTTNVPEGEKEPVQLQVSEDEPHIHSVSYTPTVPGSHTLNLTWGEGSVPLKFDVNPVQMHPHGKPVSLEINADAKPGDLDSYAVHKDTATKYKVKVHKVQKGQFKLSFQPKEPGLYAVHVLVKKRDISGSPFYIRYNKPADASACVVRGLDAPAYVSEPLKFVVDCSNAGTGDLGLRMSGPEPLQDGQISISDNHDGTFSGVFEPHVKGDHTLNITWSGKSIPESPFTINVNRRITDEWKKCYIPEKDLAVFSTPQMAGAPIDFAVSAEQAGDGEITAFVDGPSKPDVKVKNNGDGTFSCHMSPSVAGKYDLSILWEGYHISGSPIALYIKPSPILMGVNLEGQRFQAGLPQNFVISCEKVGKGALDVRCDPPTAGDIRITPDADVPNSCSCRLLPKEVGDHRIAVMYNEMHVQGSPFNVHFIQPSAANMTFTLSGEGIDVGDVSATLESAATSQEVPITLNQLMGGQFGLEFTPTQGLEYMLTLRCRIKIKVEEQQVQGSPFVLDYTSDAAQCIASGEGLSRAEVGEWSKFTVDTSSAGEGELTVDIAGDGDKPEVSISRITHHQYEVSYRLTAKGSYQLAVYWAGKLITGSPFTIECSETRKQMFQVLQLPTSVQAGHPIEFEIKPEGTEEDGGVTASATLPSGEVVIGDVVSEGGGSYKCAIKTTESGTYSIDLFFGGKKIFETPIQITVLAP